jgi:thiamine biosynthesis lipoprotein ApbE
MKQSGIENGFIDARGDMRIFGSIPEIIEIQHPRFDKGIRPLVFENSSVATSGDYNQYFKDFKTNHIIGSSDIISVTVFDELLVDADALATCLMLMGKDFALKYCKENNISAFIIDEHLNEYPFNIKETFLED